MRDEPAEGETELRYPIRGTFAGCCASAIRKGLKPKTANQRTMIVFPLIRLSVYCRLMPSVQDIFCLKACRCHSATRVPVALGRTDGMELANFTRRSRYPALSTRNTGMLPGWFSNIHSGGFWFGCRASWDFPGNLR